MDKATGELRWLNGTGIAPYDTTYSTPTITVIDGQQTMVFASGDGEVWAMQPRTGKPLWHFPFSRMGINVSPTVDDKGRVYVSHSEENTFGNTMGSVVCLDGSQERRPHRQGNLAAVRSHGRQGVAGAARWPTVFCR